MTHPVRDRAEQLASLGRELESLIRTASQQADLFDVNWRPPQTAAAARSQRTITIAVHEAWTLIRATRGSSSRDVTGRRGDALLLIALRHALDMITTGAGDDAAAVAAVELIGRTTREWLRQHGAKTAKRTLSAAKRTALAEAEAAVTAAGKTTRKAHAAAVQKQAHGLNIIAIKRPNQPVRHNSTPANRSKEDAAG